MEFTDAVLSANIARVEQLLNNGEDVNQVLLRGETALHFAGITGKLDLAELLVKHGATMEATDEDGRTPLITAVMANQVAIVRLLLDQGANGEATDNQGISAFRWASLKARELSDARIVQMMLPRMEFALAVKRNDITLVRQLLIDGEDANQILIASNPRGEPALHFVCVLGYREVAELLLNYGADMGALSRDGRTPLITAVMAGKFEIVQLLLDRGASTETLDRDRRTPLKYAAVMATESDVRIFQLLLEYKTNVAPRNVSTPLEYIALIDDEDTAKTVRLVGLLLDYGADIESQGIMDTGGTLLHMTTMRGQVRLTRLLLQRGANLFAADLNGNTPFSIAKELKNKDMVFLMLSHDPNRIVTEELADMT